MSPLEIRLKINSWKEKIVTSSSPWYKFSMSVKFLISGFRQQEKEIFFCFFFFLFVCLFYFRPDQYFPLIPTLLKWFVKT
jgi:hypothetical protein